MKFTKDGIHMIIGIHIERPLQIILRNRILRKLQDIWSDLPLQNYMGKKCLMKVLQLEELIGNYMALEKPRKSTIFTYKII